MAEALPQPADIKASFNLGGGENLRKSRLGTQMIDKKLQVMRATYDFAVEGGAIQAHNLKDVDGKDAVLPDNAVIMKTIVDVITAPTSGGAPTISLGANTGVDLKALTAIASYTGIVAAIPVGTAATAVKTTAKRTLTATIAVATVTAGKFHVWVEYYVSED